MFKNLLTYSSFIRKNIKFAKKINIVVPRLNNSKNKLETFKQLNIKQSLHEDVIFKTLNYQKHWLNIIS